MYSIWCISLWFYGKTENYEDADGCGLQGAMYILNFMYIDGKISGSTKIQSLPLCNKK
jgi:hypothetical protein